EPIAELPQIVNDCSQRRTMFAVRGSHSPFHVHRGRQRNEWRPAIPVARNEPKIKSQQRPANSNMFHIALVMSHSYTSLALALPTIPPQPKCFSKLGVLLFMASKHIWSMSRSTFQPEATDNL